LLEPSPHSDRRAIVPSSSDSDRRGDETDTVEVLLRPLLSRSESPLVKPEKIVLFNLYHLQILFFFLPTP
jgi:hypothetical protein